TTNGIGSPIPTSTITSTPTNTPTNTPTVTLTPTGTPPTHTPTPLCCNNVTGTAIAWCDYYYTHDWIYGYTLNNNCDHAVIGSGTLVIERQRRDGVWEEAMYTRITFNNRPFQAGQTRENYSTRLNPYDDYYAWRSRLHLT